MTILTTLIKEDNHFQDLNQVFGQANTLVTGLSPSAKVTMIAEKYAQSNQQLLLITNNLYQADKLETDLLQFIDAEELYKYPVQDIMTEEFSTQSPQLMSERIRTLTALAQGKKGLFIVPLNGLKKWLTPVEMWQNHQMTLRVGEDIELGNQSELSYLIPKLILFGILMLKRSVPKIMLKKSISQLQVIISLLKK